MFGGFYYFSWWRNARLVLRSNTRLIRLMTGSLFVGLTAGDQQVLLRNTRLIR